VRGGNHMGGKGNLKGSVGKFKSAIVRLLHDISITCFRYFVFGMVSENCFMKRPWQLQNYVVLMIDK